MNLGLLGCVILFGQYGRAARGERKSFVAQIVSEIPHAAPAAQHRQTVRLKTDKAGAGRRALSHSGNTAEANGDAMT